MKKSDIINSTQVMELRKSAVNSARFILTAEELDRFEIWLAKNNVYSLWTLEEYLYRPSSIDELVECFIN